MKKLITLALAMSALLAFPAQALAAVNYNRLIDDFVFSSSGKMTAAQINTFLNSQPNSCISPNKGFKAREPIGYTPSKGFIYGSSNVSAGQIIYVASKVYGINPQVLLSTLQKEQGFVSGPGYYDCTNPLSSSAKLGYTQVMGYGCPDGGTTYDYSGVNLYTIGSTTVTSVNNTCVNAKTKAGFTQQVIRAAWLLKFGQQRSLGNTSWNVQLRDFPHAGNVWDNSDDPLTCYGGPMTQGYRKRCSSDTKTKYYDGYTTIDSTSVHMDTGATAALYWYTPHKSGNSHFVSIFEGWFGSTRTTPIKVNVIDGGTSETGGTATVQFSLVVQPTANVVIPLSVTDATEATLNGVTSKTITPANWNQPQNNAVTITGVTDAIADGDIAYTLITGDPSSNDAAYGNLTAADVKDVALLNTDKEPDVPLAGDWDGDGIDEIGLKRGNEYILNYGNDGKEEVRFHFGRYDDIAIAGDWDGDGRDEIGLKRGNAYYLNYGNDGTQEVGFNYGRADDTPLAGDWDKDGKDEIALKRGNWYYLNYGNDGMQEVGFRYGYSTDTPLAGDWDKDGRDEIGIQRGNLFALTSDNDGDAESVFRYGHSGDIAFAGDWDKDGRDEIGIKRGNLYALTYDNDGDAEVTFRFGR